MAALDAERYAQDDYDQDAAFCSFVAGCFCGIRLRLGNEAIDSSNQLARFIYQMVTDEVPVNELLRGIESTGTLKLPECQVEIPIREVFGTIILERFGDKIDDQLFEDQKKYEVRAICAFRGRKDHVWRFHITIFEERQYKTM